MASGSCRIPEDWFAKQVALADRTDGDIDTLANRIAHIRTWTFVSNRPDWLKDPAHWQERTRAIEDSLSDALHECLTQRFVDRRTSALMKGMRDKDELHADIAEDGLVLATLALALVHPWWALALLIVATIAFIIAIVLLYRLVRHVARRVRVAVA